MTPNNQPKKSVPKAETGRPMAIPTEAQTTRSWLWPMILVTVVAVCLGAFAVLLWRWNRGRVLDDQPPVTPRDRIETVGHDRPVAEEPREMEERREGEEHPGEEHPVEDDHPALGQSGQEVPSFRHASQPSTNPDPGAGAPTAEAVVAPNSSAPTQIFPPDEDIIYHGAKDGRMEVALSFDDGPHPYYTPLILEILAEYDIRATFFMVGENVTYYTDAARAVLEAGHEVGNHTFSHCKFNRMDEKAMREEIAACEDAISSIAEYRPHFLRPPEGQMNATMRRVSGALDYRIVLWDVDTRDWDHTAPEVICQNILDTVQAGDIILMHDFIGHNSPTPEALRLVIPQLLERGYHFVTVSELVDGE